MQNLEMIGLLLIMIFNRVSINTSIYMYMCVYVYNILFLKDLLIKILKMEYDFLKCYVLV